MIRFEIRRLSATLALLPIDGFARDRGHLGPRPGPIGPLKYFLMGRVGDGADFDRPLELITRRNPSGYDLFFHEARRREPESLPVGRSDEFDTPGPSRSKPRRVQLADGTYRLRVVSRFHALLDREVAIPDPALSPAPGGPSTDPAAVVLAPGYMYPFPPGTTLLRGVVQETDGRGVAGAKVRVLSITQVDYLTDPTGQWAIAFPDSQPSGTVTVQIDRPGGAQESVDVEIEAGAEHSLRPTALRGWVMRASGAAIPGASVSVGGLGAVSTGQDGGWSFIFAPGQGEEGVDVTAEVAGAATQTQADIPVMPGKTVTVPTFRFN